MANTVDYGLKFEIKELEKIKLQAKAIDKYFDSIANSTKFKSLSKTIQEMNTLFKNQEAILGMVNNKRDLEIKKQKELIVLQEKRKKLEQDILDTMGKTPKNGGGGGNRSRTGSGGSNGGDGKFDMFAPAKVAKRVAGYIGMSTAVYGSLAALRAGRDAVIEYDQALNDTYMAMKNVTMADKAMIRSITTNSDLTAKYGKDYVELAKSLEVLVKAGLKLGEANIMLEPSLKLAVAGGMELDEAARALTQSLRNMGKPIGYANEMADALAAGAAASAVDIKDLIVSLEGVGAAGTTFGMQAKELVAWIGAVGNVGLKGKEAANAISRMWLRITKPQKEVQDILKKGKIEIFEGVGTEQRLRKFEDIMNDLANSTLSLSEKQKLLGVHAFKSGEQIQSAVLSYQNLSHEMKNVNDEAERMAKQKMEGLQGKIDKLKATWNDIFITQGGISSSLGFAVDKVTTLLAWIDANPEMARLMFIAAAGAVGAAGGAMVAGIPGAIVGGVGAAGLTTYGLWGMDTSENISREKRQATENAFKKKAEEFAEWQIRHERKLSDVKTFTFKKLEQELLDANKILKKRNEEEDVFIQKVKEKYDAYEKIKKLEITGAELSKIASKQEYRDRGWGAAQVKEELLKRAKQEIFNAEVALQGFQVGKQYINQRVLSAQKEITTRKQAGTTGDGTGGTTPKEHYDSLLAWEEKMLKLSNDYRQKQFKNVDEGALELNSRYEELYLELENNKWKHGEKEKALNALEMANTVGNAKLISDMLVIARDNELKLAEQWNESRAKAMGDAHEQQLKEMEDYLEKQKELRQKYQGIDGALSDLKQQMMDEIVLAEGNEEIIFNIKRDYAEQAMQLYKSDWEERNKIASTALGSMEAGFGSFSQAMSDDLQISKNESEMIWEAMKQSFIQKIMEMAWAAALSGIFSFFMNPAQSFLGGFGKIGGLNSAIGGGVMGGTPGFGVGSIFNAPSLGGGMGGTSLPSMAMVQGTGGVANNNALINELRSLRLAVARSDANNVKAINENTPVIQGKFLDAVDVYKTSKIGERKSNFIVSPK